MAKSKRERQAKEIIAIAAGKGGVGKSAVTVNLALALKKNGFTVGILDADLYGPSIRKMMREDRLPSKNGERLIPASSQGIPIISMAYFRPEDEAVAVRAPIANQLIQQFLLQVDWPDLDYLLIDFPPGTGDIPLSLGQKARLSSAILVTTPQEIALQDVRKAAALFHTLNVPITGVIENMSYIEVQGQKLFPFGQGGGASLAKELKVPLLGTIPLDPEISMAADRGDARPLDLFDPIAKTIEKNKGDLPAFSARCLKDCFELILKDGTIRSIQFHEIQKSCPCAGCLEEKSCDQEVKILHFEPVGRYAVKFRFSSGCSSGIYSLEKLTTLGVKQ